MELENEYGINIWFKVKKTKFIIYHLTNFTECNVTWLFYFIFTFFYQNPDEYKTVEDILISKVAESIK